MPNTIAIPRESRSGELRVAIDPVVAGSLLALPGVDLVIETDCGRGAGFNDAAYRGVRVAPGFGETVAHADLTLKVVPPSVEEAALLPQGSVLVCQMSPFQNLPAIEILQLRRITTLAVDLLPRTTRAQAMDVLSSQATVAGYKAALLAAELCPRLFPMMITAAGTLRPSRVVVIGAGVAGLQAIATCRRLGAQVRAYDIRRAAKEQIESLGASTIDTGVEAESHGGYARSLTRDELQTQHDVLATHLAQAHAVICAAAIPGRVAPQIITEDMVDGMMPDTVIIDMAADTGGNCVLTRPGETVQHRETLIVGALNLPSRGAVHASEMYARNLSSLLALILPEGQLGFDWDDAILAECRLTHDGEICHAPTLALLNEARQAHGDPDTATLETSSPVDAASGPPSTAATLRSAGTVPAAGKGNAPPGDLVAGWPDDDPPAAEPAVGGKSDQGTGRSTASTERSDPAGQVRNETPDEPADDFTRLRGVGPALNSSLLAYGFTRYRQIAELDARGIERLEQQLELDGHILRDDWPGQARRLERFS